MKDTGMNSCNFSRGLAFKAGRKQAPAERLHAHGPAYRTCRGQGPTLVWAFKIGIQLWREEVVTLPVNQKAKQRMRRAFELYYFS